LHVQESKLTLYLSRSLPLSGSLMVFENMTKTARSVAQVFDSAFASNWVLVGGAANTAETPTSSDRNRSQFASDQMIDSLSSEENTEV
jgi:hypothetical protein